ncbi:MAG: molybdate ABC transporter substrate-binding protein [Chromatiales bacterium]
MLRTTAYLFFFLAAFLPTGNLKAEEIHIAVASNFSATMRLLAERFEAQSDHRVILLPGSTGKHFAQIVNGAPFDAFFAADVKRPERLEAEGRIIPGSRFSYAIGKLVLWSPDPELVDGDGAVLESGTFRRLAIANPRLAPYGRAAQQFLESRGIRESLRPKLVRGENIGQAFQFVASGNAELGLVALSQLMQSGREPAGSRWQVPEKLHAPIEQQAVLLSDSAAAADFMRFAKSEPARAIIRDSGYGIP